MRGRLILLGLVVAGLAPGTCVQTDHADDLRPILRAERLTVERTTIGPFAIEGVWHLTSPNTHFGGWSALIAPAHGDLVAISDRGRWMRFAPPSATGAVRARFGVLGGTVQTDKRAVDAEAAAHDRASGTTWVAYERTNSIERHADMAFVGARRAHPPAMARWPKNKGAEAMTRLPDGRFLVIGEGSPDWAAAAFPALLFEGDPVDGAAALEFTFALPDGYRPTSAAALPDGRVLIVARRVDRYLPPRFSALLMVAEPAAIRAGETWRGDILATIDGDLPRDNFEGLAVVPEADGALTLWLISDDNTAALQRTLLYKLRWMPDTQKARGNPGRPAMSRLRP